MLSVLCRLRRRFDPREIQRVVEKRDGLALSAAAAVTAELEGGADTGALVLRVAGATCSALVHVAWVAGGGRRLAP